MYGSSWPPDYDDDDDSTVFEPGDGLPTMLLAVLVIGVIALIYVVSLIASALR